jgi:phosphoglycolate phosphatase-like HAD superfamily hydrolase
MNRDEIKTLIFDLDGVITSEMKYWNTARLTVWEIIAGDRYLAIKNYFGHPSDIPDVLVNLGDQVISSQFIYELKSRAINSNWDLTFFVVCLHLLGIVNHYQETTKAFNLDFLEADHLDLSDKLKQLGNLLQSHEYNAQISHPIIEQFWQETRSLTGEAVLNYIQLFLHQKLGKDFSFFHPKGELWQLCYENFQAWYEGKKGYDLPDDETVLDLKAIASALSILHDSKRFTLAIATGRPRVEVIQPLTTLGLLPYFDRDRIVTYDEVLEAESIMNQLQQPITLGKPHPFILFRAIYLNQDIPTLCKPDFKFTHGHEIAYIGDAGSDVVAAKRAGCLSIGVLTGFSEGKARENKQKMLADKGCDVILESVLDLPQFLGVTIH